MHQKRIVFGGKSSLEMEPQIDEKTTPKKRWGKRGAKGRGTAKKHVLGAPCNLKVCISIGRGYKNEQWQLTFSRSLKRHKNTILMISRRHFWFQIRFCWRSFNNMFLASCWTTFWFEFQAILGPKMAQVFDILFGRFQ